MTPLVSVITPIYNCQQYLEESLSSILDQSFRDYEFLIYNDGSTDASVDVVSKFDDDRITFIDDVHNIKIPRRRNQMIRDARGKYVVIHDGDDVTLPGRLEKQINFLESHDDIFCVGGHAVKIDTGGNHIGMMRYPPETHEQIVSEIIDKVTNPIIDPTTIFRRNVFINLGCYTLRTDIYTVPDFDIWTKALLKGFKFANLQEPVIKYRVNPDGMTVKNKTEMIQAFMTVWRPFVAAFGRQPAFIRKRYGN